nr:hypothetical protein [Streptomyces microflavus]
MAITEEKRPAAEPGAQPRPRRSAWVWGWLFTGAFSVVAVLLALLGYLGEGVAGGDVDWAALLTESSWNPSGSVFGGLAMIYGSAVVCVIALVLAVPVGWGAAVALSEYVPGRTARALRMSVELLAAVPSIVYGLIGILLIRPFVGSIADVPGGDSLLAAGMVLAVMIMPTIVAVSVDSLAAVPTATGRRPSRWG